MIVLVESNFVLELAFLQSEEAEALKLLELAEQKALSLVIPAYALVEPLEKLKRNRADRRRFAEDLERELKQMARTRDFAHIYGASSAVRSAMATKAQVDEERFFETVEKLRRHSDVLPLTSETIATSTDFQYVFDFSPQDAIIFASVVEFLKPGGRGVSVFANKNSKDFLAPEVVEFLAPWGCTVVPTFANALSFFEREAARVRG